MRIDVPPRRGPGCTACSFRASKRARPCAWSWCRQSHWRCPGGACATCAWRCGPTSRRHPESSRKEGKDVREVRRRAWKAEYVLSRCREDVARHIVARTCTASHPTPPRLRVIVATRIGRGESARRTCRHARRRAGGGGRTHQASALGLLAEVVEQRGHVAEALGGIFPANRGAIRRRSVVFRSFSSVPQSHARSCFVASGSPKNRTRPVRWRRRRDGATRT